MSRTALPGVRLDETRGFDLVAGQRGCGGPRRRVRTTVPMTATTWLLGLLTGAVVTPPVASAHAGSKGADVPSGRLTPTADPNAAAERLGGRRRAMERFSLWYKGFAAPRRRSAGGHGGAQRNYGSACAGSNPRRPPPKSHVGSASTHPGRATEISASVQAAAEYDCRPGLAPTSGV